MGKFRVTRSMAEEEVVTRPFFHPTTKESYVSKAKVGSLAPTLREVEEDEESHDRGPCARLPASAKKLASSPLSP